MKGVDAERACEGCSRMAHDGPGCRARVGYIDVSRMEGVDLSRMEGIDAERLLGIDADCM
jgi:hypothetical protein